MHPHTQRAHASLRMQDELTAAARRRDRLPRRARPPSRGRRVVIRILVAVTARVTDEPVVVLPRRV